MNNCSLLSVLILACIQRIICTCGTTYTEPITPYNDISYLSSLLNSRCTGDSIQLKKWLEKDVLEYTNTSSSTDIKTKSDAYSHLGPWIAQYNHHCLLELDPSLISNNFLNTDFYQYDEYTNANEFLDVVRPHFHVAFPSSRYFYLPCGTELKWSKEFSMNIGTDPRLYYNPSILSNSMLIKLRVWNRQKIRYSIPQGFDSSPNTVIRFYGKVSLDIKHGTRIIFMENCRITMSARSFIHDNYGKQLYSLCMRSDFDVPEDHVVDLSFYSDTRVELLSINYKESALTESQCNEPEKHFPFFQIILVGEVAIPNFKEDPPEIKELPPLVIRGGTCDLLQIMNETSVITLTFNGTDNNIKLFDSGYAKFVRPLYIQSLSSKEANLTLGRPRTIQVHLPSISQAVLHILVESIQNPTPGWCEKAKQKAFFTGIDTKDIDNFHLKLPLYHNQGNISDATFEFARRLHNLCYPNITIPLSDLDNPSMNPTYFVFDSHRYLNLLPKFMPLKQEQDIV